jgi:hypothetical protein
MTVGCHDCFHARMRAVVHPRRARPQTRPTSSLYAGSLNIFGRNEIEVAPISSALFRIACLVILYKLWGIRTGMMGYQDRYEETRSSNNAPEFVP